MKTEILNILNPNETTRVAFRCSSGEAVGRWDGVAAVVGDVRHVELDCDGAFDAMRGF